MRAIWAPGLFLLGILLASCLGGGDTSLPGLGEACDQDTPCREGFCFGRPGRQLCTSHCEDDDSCWPGSICEPDPDLENLVCVVGARCEDDTSCPLGHRCDTVTRSCHLAVERDLCGACTTDAQCPDGGLCVRADSTDERFCSSPCEASQDCPHGFTCRTVFHEGEFYGGGERSRQCIPTAETCNAEKPLCSPCEGDWECGFALDLCLEDRMSGERRCGRGCRPSCVWDESRLAHFDEETDAPCSSGCPAGFSCLDVGGPIEQCVPERRSCTDHCDASTSLEERLQCGPGRACDRVAGHCVDATDGRTCSPCDRGECPSSGPRISACVVSHGKGESFCATACDGDDDCRSAYGIGFSCREVEGRRFCLPDSGSCREGIAPLGADCREGGDCAGSLCLRFGEDGLFSGPCQRDADCQDARWICCARGEGEPGFDCALPLGEEGGACVPRGGRFGSSCEDGRPPCESGYCLDVGAERICTAGCESDADCDAASGRVGAYRCSRALLDADRFERVDVCFPVGGGVLGSDCTFGPAACADGICLERAHGRICSRECQPGGCPPGWRCDLASTKEGAELRVCLPGG